MTVLDETSSNSAAPSADSGAAMEPATASGTKSRSYQVIDPASSTLPARALRRYNRRAFKGEKLSAPTAMDASVTYQLAAMGATVTAPMWVFASAGPLSLGVVATVLSTAALAASPFALARRYLRREGQAASEVMVATMGGSEEGRALQMADAAAQRIRSLEVWSSGDLDVSARMDLDVELSEVLLTTARLQKLRASLEDQEERLGDLPDVAPVLAAQRSELERVSAELLARAEGFARYADGIVELDRQRHALSALKRVGENDVLLNRVHSSSVVGGASESVHLSSSQLEAASSRYEAQLELLRGVRRELSA